MANLTEKAQKSFFQTAFIIGAKDASTVAPEGRTQIGMEFK
jgi:hypothetical protein